MKPTPEQILASVKTMRLAIAFVPTVEEDTAIILISLANMVATKGQLDWLTYTACNVMPKWSLAELRGLFCSRFDPDDGIRVDCTIPNFTPAEVARRNEAIPLEDPTRLLAMVPEPPPSDEERKEWAQLEDKIRGATRARKIPTARPRPIAAELRAAEEELARQVANMPPIDPTKLEAAVRDLERKLGL